MKASELKALLLAATLFMLTSGCGVERTTEISGLENLNNTADNSENSEGEDSENVYKPKTAPPSGYTFEAPVRLKAGDEFVSVEAPGYACPTMADVDGDGLEDLVVGQFNRGYMQFCKNIASSSEPPKFAEAKWIKAGDDKAEVPGVW